MTTTTMTQKPRHIAIVMDGNGRWAKKRFLPRIAGHQAGTRAVRATVKWCAENNIEALTLFAFSSENWRRPAAEVSHLMELFLSTLEREAKKLHQQNIKLRIIGDRSRFDEKLQQQMRNAEALTAQNTGLQLLIAANYGGQWDITQAMQQLVPDIQNNIINDITPELLESKLVTANIPHPDLFIRTSGEQRISNFLLWQLAYAELYFTDILWPDFSAKELEKAIAFYNQRERRFGFTAEQLKAKDYA